MAAYLLALRFAMAVSQLAQAPFYTKLPQLATLHAGGREAEKIAALDLGANDYVEKPFGVGELLARLRVALAVLFTNSFRCPYCNEPSVLEVRGKYRY